MIKARMFVKSENELDYMRKAFKISEFAAEAILSDIKPGIIEFQVIIIAQPEIYIHDCNLDTKWGNEGYWIRKLGSSSTIYSWVMNNHWITNFTLTQDGPVTFRYRILPHGRFDITAANRFVMEQAQPLVHVTANVDQKTKPLLAIDNGKVYVTIIESLVDGKETLLRSRSLSDNLETIKHSYSVGNSESIRDCAISEEPGEPFSGPVSLLSFGMATFRISS